MKEINPDEEKIVIQAYMIHRMGARKLEKIIENDLGMFFLKTRSTGSF
jgi:hypothetical protein